MVRKVITHIRYPVLIAGIVLCLVGVAYAATNIDSTNKWAWGTNVGWINFNPSDSQVTIGPASGSFDGYAWAENVEWIHYKNTGVPAYNVATDHREQPRPAGGIVVPVNRLELLAPWLGLAALASFAALTVALVRRREGA